ncbi:MAG: nitrophenyl compound nitroreductase subunit ArsF family protein [Bacteroidota bacterium]
MKNLFIISTLIVFSISSMSFNFSNNQVNTDMKKNEFGSKKVEIYYFHNARRCATCQAVEDVTKKALKELYPEMTKSGKIVFLSLDIAQKSNQALVKKYKVSGQTLLFISNSKKVNLTNDAFMYARSNPDKLKTKIKKTVDKILN